MRVLFRLLPLLAGVLMLTACDPNQVFEKNTDFDERVWAVQQKPSFEFVIADTTQRYDVYINVRNSVLYGYYNLFVKQTLTGPDGKVISRRLHEMLLMDKQTGKPLGSGAGDIFDHQFLALRNQRFRAAGSYKIMLEQYMRQDQLPEIMAVGVRVAKVSAAAEK